MYVGEILVDERKDELNCKLELRRSTLEYERFGLGRDNTCGASLVEQENLYVWTKQINYHEKVIT